MGWLDYFTCIGALYSTINPECLQYSFKNVNAVFSLTRPFLCFTTYQFEQAFKSLANFITYFVNMCSLYYVNH